MNKIINYSMNHMAEIDSALIEISQLGDLIWQMKADSVSFWALKFSVYKLSRLIFHCFHFGSDVHINFSTCLSRCQMKGINTHLWL
jgi:hypothetical protein